MAILAGPLFLGACGFQQYLAKPIDPAVNLAKFEQKDPNDPAFQQYLVNQGYTPAQLPIKTWGLDELTYCALFFHPSLNLARAQARAAELSVDHTAASAIPTVNANLARSNDPDPAKKPYALGLSIDLPIDIANKGDMRVENARHLASIAQLEIAQEAWQLRNNLAKTWLDYQFNQQQIRLLTAEQNYQQAIVAIYQKRLDVGAASNVQLSTAKLAMQANAALLNQAEQNTLVLSNQLAIDIGLPASQLTKIVLSPHANTAINESWQAADIQKSALLNRIDLRIALERYASMEAKLKLEIANQYPDLVISPGYAYEFGDSVWSLGLSGLMAFIHKNKLAIAEASQLREVEAAQFEVLQTKIIGAVHAAHAEFEQAQQGLAQQQTSLNQQETHAKRMASLFTAGEIDRLALTLTKLETMNAEKNLAAAQHQLNNAIRQLENVLQKPLTRVGVKNEP